MKTKFLKPVPGICNQETLAGFLIDLARDIPEGGAVVSYRKYRPVVERVSDHAIQQVIIRW